MRVELSNGNWAELREGITVGDLKFQREVAHLRGYEDAALDMIALFPRLISSWSLGEVSDAGVDALSLEDMAVIRDAYNAVPNESAPSSDGTSRAKARSRSKD